MSKESALANATGQPAPTTIAPPVNNLAVTPRQAARVLVPKDVAAPIEPVQPSPKQDIVEPNPLDSDRFAHLAKKEAALQKQREELKAQQASMAAEKAKYEEVGKKYGEFEKLKSTDPIAAMKLAGFSDTDIFNYYVKAQEDAKTKDTPEARAAAAAQVEIKKFEEAQTKKEQMAKEAQDSATIKKFQGKIAQTIAGDKDKYEFCNHNGIMAEQLIFATVEEYLKETGEVLTPQQAADMVEEHYEAQAKALDNLKKRQRGEPVQEPPPQPSTSKSQPSKTLTNKVTPTVASTITKKETPTEKRDRLIKQIQEHGLRK